MPPGPKLRRVIIAARFRIRIRSDTRVLRSLAMRTWPWWSSRSPSPRECGLRCDGVVGWCGEHERVEQSGEIGCEDEMPGLFFL